MILKLREESVSFFYLPTLFKLLGLELARTYGRKYVEIIGGIPSIRVRYL